MTQFLEILKQIESTYAITLRDAVIGELSNERRAIYAPFLSRETNTLQSLVGTDTMTGQMVEIIVEAGSDGGYSLPDVSCLIMYEDMPLSHCPEYCFEDDPEWRVAKISLIALEDFKAKKFKLWEHQLKEPECEAAFRRLLQQGPIRNVFDKFIFPSSDEVAQKYKVKDEHSGKLVDIPHQVGRMRLWNVETGRYDEFDCSLAGAPTNENEAKVYWEQLMTEMRTLRGAEYIDSLLGSH